MGQLEVSFSPSLASLSALTRTHIFLSSVSFNPPQRFLGFSGPPYLSVSFEPTFPFRRQLVLSLPVPQQRRRPISFERYQQPSHSRIHQWLPTRSSGSTSQSAHGSLRILQGSSTLDLPSSHRQPKLENVVPSASVSPTTTTTCTYFQLLLFLEPSAATTTADPLPSSVTASSSSSSDSPPRSRSRSLLVLRPLQPLPSLPAQPLPSPPPSTPTAAIPPTSEPAAAHPILATPHPFRSRSTGQIVR